MKRIQKVKENKWIKKVAAAAATATTATKIELSSLQMRIMNAKNVNLRTYFDRRDKRNQQQQ